MKMIWRVIGLSLATSSPFGLAVAQQPAQADTHDARAGEGMAGVWELAGAAPEDKAPYKPEWLAEHGSNLVNINPSLTSDPRCLPPGLPGILLKAKRLQIVPQPTQFVVITEDPYSIRRIYTDGRTHPEDMWVTFNGYSIGAWSRGALTAETIRLHDDIPVGGSLPSDAMTVAETYRLAGDGSLEIAVTVTDAKAMIRPWEFTLRYNRIANGVLEEHVCEDPAVIKDIVNRKRAD